VTRLPIPLRERAGSRQPALAGRIAGGSFNQRSSDRQTRDEAINPLLYKAADAVTDWPANDLFEQGDKTRAR